jgi:hypothetical protein
VWELPKTISYLRNQRDNAWLIYELTSKIINWENSIKIYIIENEISAANSIKLSITIMMLMTNGTILISATTNTIRPAGLEIKPCYRLHYMAKSDINQREIE